MFSPKKTPQPAPHKDDFVALLEPISHLYFEKFKCDVTSNSLKSFIQDQFLSSSLLNYFKEEVYYAALAPDSLDIFCSLLLVVPQSEFEKPERSTVEMMTENARKNLTGYQILGAVVSQGQGEKIWVKNPFYEKIDELKGLKEAYHSLNQDDLIADCKSKNEAIKKLVIKFCDTTAQHERLIINCFLKAMNIKIDEIYHDIQVEQQNKPTVNRLR